ncbi:phosphatase domain-containing putative toxin [Psychrobacter alimentarius]|uniref:phosphatase domain-containing putative toxin n=1 Tax=Psychrobacter alimentarius TaxID=261164 RepID=UPI00191813F0|nr:sulfur transferase domain-containing protein [Psychrobacter alimentarius]
MTSQNPSSQDLSSQGSSLQGNATSKEQTDGLVAVDTAVNHNESDDRSLSDHSGSDSLINDDSVHDAPDNSVNLAAVIEPYFRPDENTIVCGALDEEKVATLAKAGIDVVINLQPDAELSFDEAAAVERAGMGYEHLPINGAADLKQLKILAFDNILRQHHGKKIAVHCGSGNRVGAAIALRAGWLRGRKMDTAMERGRSHGLTKLEDEVFKRLLVPR